MQQLNLNGLRLGVSSAATQIEGGDVDHSWAEWARRGHIRDGASPARANDHYRRFPEDASLMQSLGIRHYRLGVEWARIEPEPGRFDEAAIEHYRAELSDLRARGIEPLVTLHHFTNPMWFERMGAFERAENLPHFLRFAEHVVRAFGDLAAEYITINEPNVYAANGYFFGLWPPGVTSLRRTLRVMSVLTAAHLSCYGMIHRVRAELGLAGTKVAFANHLRVFAPAREASPLHRAFASIADRFFQGSLSVAMTTGRVAFPLRRIARLPAGRYCDFHAVNYYTRSTVSGLADGVRAGAPVNDLGWEIYPAGIVQCAARMHALCPLPIYITENGVCDNQDAYRCRYIYEHLKALLESGLPVERYYHWCFTDNFEWAEGESARFGLVHVDYDTQARTVKRSGRFFAAMIAAGGVDAALYDAYVKPCTYPTNGGGR